MALPTLIYNDWRFKVNVDLNSPGTGLACFQQLLYNIKESLISSSGWTNSSGSSVSASSPWTVIASSDGSTADATDLWDSTTDLNWAASGSAHSWIVLRQTGIHGSNFEICIDLDNSAANYHTITIVVSWGGFTIGTPSTSNRPTATDELIIRSQVAWVTDTATTFDCSLHTLMTNDGEITRVVICVSGSPISQWHFEKPSSAVSGWSNPSIALVLARNSTTYANLNSAANLNFRYDGSNLTSYFTSLTHRGVGSGTVLTIANDISSSWPLWPIRIARNIFPVGIFGTIDDIWFGSSGLSDGDCYPGSGTVNQFIQLADLVYPWNQSTPLMG